MPNSFIIEEFQDFKVLIFSHNTSENIKYSIEIPLGSGRAILRFVDGEIPDNTSEMLGGKTIYYVYFSSNQYRAMYDLLLFEEPLFFYYNVDNHESYITSTEEHIGEH